MQLRLPWILSRRRLLAALILDSALFVVLYNGLFLQRFGRWPYGSIFLPVLWAMWLLSSYVLGRYQGVDSARSPSVSLMALQGVVKTSLVVGFSLGGTVTYLWLFKSNAGYFLFHNFYLPFTTSSYFLFPNSDTCLRFLLISHFSCLAHEFLFLPFALFLIYDFFF